MSKVSTRPQKPATLVTAPETPVATRAHQSPTCLQAQAPMSPVASTALAIVEQVKLDHHQGLDSENISVHSMTLVELAEKTLQQLVTAETADAGFENVKEALAFEAAALLAGALAWDVKDSPKATSRHHLGEQAYLLMDAAAMSFGLEGSPCVALSIGVQAGATAERHKGYTALQMHNALETIAGRANTLESMLVEISRSCIGMVRACEVSTAIEAAVIVANSIGIISDEASGADIVGNWEVWTFGPNFSARGKAVQS